MQHMQSTTRSSSSMMPTTNTIQWLRETPVKRTECLRVKSSTSMQESKYVYFQNCQTFPLRDFHTESKANLNTLLFVQGMVFIVAYSPVIADPAIPFCPFPPVSSPDLLDPDYLSSIHTRAVFQITYFLLSAAALTKYVLLHALCINVNSLVCIQLGHTTSS